MNELRNYYLLIKSVGLTIPITPEVFESIKSKFLSDFLFEISPSIILHYFSSDFLVLEEVVINLYAKDS